MTNINGKPHAIVATPDEYVAEATKNIAIGLQLNWGYNWDWRMRQEVIAHLLKVANTLEKIGYR